MHVVMRSRIARTDHPVRIDDLSQRLRPILLRSLPRRVAQCRETFDPVLRHFPATPPDRGIRDTTVGSALMISLPDDLAEQPLGLLLQRQDVGADLLQRAQRLRLVEVAGEADLVADLDARRVDTRRRRVRQHLALDEGLDAARLPAAAPARCRAGRCRARIRRRTVLPSIVASNRPRSGSARLARLVDLPDDGRRVLVALGRLLERLDLLRRVGAVGVDAA